MKINRVVLLAMVLTRSQRSHGLGLTKVSVRKSSTTKLEAIKVQKPASKKDKSVPKHGTRVTALENRSTTTPTALEASQSSPILLSLPEDAIEGVLRSRPSKRNRSPYVADVFIEQEQREVIVHVPNLDMGGKCIPGAAILMKPARDKKGNLVGPDAVNPKFGTPKCEFIAQLLRVDESELGYEPTWCGAHPSLGEKIAEQLVQLNLLGPEFPRVKSFRREVQNVGGADMRADFVIEHEDETLPRRILEVKTVVDTDYSVSATPSRAKCVFTSDKLPYQRTAIFPWGSSNQKGPEGEKVVSSRAIKHIRELSRLKTKGEFDTTVLFVIIRNDAKAFRPNHEACPSFARYLNEAKEAGVQILAKQVCWGDGKDVGKCFEGPLLEIDWPGIE